MENEYHPVELTHSVFVSIFSVKKRGMLFQKDIKTAIEFTNQKRLIMKEARVVDKSRRRNRQFYIFLRRTLFSVKIENFPWPFRKIIKT